MNNTILLPNTGCFAQNINVKFKRCFQEKLFLTHSKIQETGSFSDQQQFFFDIIQYNFMSWHVLQNFQQTAQDNKKQQLCM